MRHSLRGFIILLFAVALVVNGAGSRVLGDIQTANAHHFAAKKGLADHHGQHGSHHLAQAKSADVASDHSSMHHHGGDGAKCCTTCIILDNLTPAFMATANQFRYRTVVFKFGRQNLVGHLVPLDPDIPKSIV